VWEYNPEGPTIDNMDMKLFYGSAICVDLTSVTYPDYIEVKDIEKAVEKAGLTIEKGDIFLMYTGHYDRTYAKGDIKGYMEPYTGLSYDATEYLAKKGVVNIGVDASAIDLTPDDLDFSGHWVCGKYGMTNTENMRNLGKVAGKRFIYFGLPLRIRAGTGSPIRAVALLEK
nr:cyclase family protein [Oscillospiraceae bacterium]